MIPKLAAALAFILLNFYIFNFMGRALTIPLRQDFASYPDRVGAFECPDRGSLDDDVIDTLGVTDYIVCRFYEDETAESVDFYVGYHERQVRSDEGKETTIHPPEHCLPGGGWDIVSNEIVPIDFGISGQAKRVIIARGNQRQLVYFWYQSRGHVIAHDYEKILRMFADRATTGRTDGALVRITVPVDREGGIEHAEEILHRFAAVAAPPLDPYVPR